MFKIKINELQKMSREDLDKLLLELINRGDRGFF